VPFENKTIHRVTVRHDARRVRAVCSCGEFMSPWVTADVRPDEDIPPRTELEQRAARAGEWHIRMMAGGHK
jgi:hypothetical protein